MKTQSLLDETHMPEGFLEEEGLLTLPQTGETWGPLG